MILPFSFLRRSLHRRLCRIQHIFDEDPVDGGGRTPDPVTTVLTLSRAVLIPCTAPYYERCSNHYTHMVENWEWTEATYIMGNGTVTLRMNGEKVE